MWVLSTIQGYQVDFLWEPLQSVQPHTPQYSVEQGQLIVEEIQELLGKGAITEVHDPQGGFYSNLFLVPKKDGRQRPVINLKALNSLVHTEHFKVEGIHTLRDLVNLEDWLTKVDQQKYYFTAFHLACHQLLLFNILKPTLALLREMGVQLIAYIDNILVLAESQTGCISVPPGMPGFQEKISVSASPSDGIPGLYSRYSPNGAEAPSG